MSFYIKNASDAVGKEITVQGWLYHKRSSGKIRFLVVRDGTGFMQCVMGMKDVDEQTFALFDQLTYESSLAVTGTIHEDKRAPGGYEMSISNIKVFQIAEPFPIQPKEHGIEFLLDNRHLWLRSSKQVAIMRIRDEVEKAIRDFFYERNFNLMDSPILTSSIGESAGELFSTDYFDMGKAYLAQTGQLYLEAAIYGLGRVYCFGPTFRAEKSKTRRHLTEFWMVEAEAAFYDNEMNIALQEEMIEYIVARVLENRADELHTLERDITPLQKIKRPFNKVSYDDAIDYLKKNGSDIEWGEDLGGDEQTIISNMSDQPTFVMNFPREAKAFYMKEHPDRKELVLCSDLLAPEGYGEIIGGSQREDDYDKLIVRIHEQRLPEEAYRWYLDLRKYGSVLHSGFGLGVERTVGWIAGRHHIRETIPFPRTINRIYP